MNKATLLWAALVLAAGCSCEDLQPVGGRAQKKQAAAASRGAVAGRPVTATVVTDRRCSDPGCETAGLEQNLRRRFWADLEVRRVDYGSAEGRRLFAELDLERLPAWLFARDAVSRAKSPTIGRWMKPVGAYLRLRAPAPFDPTAEVCDNGVDDTGNGAIDCADATCRQRLVCREEIPARLDLFVMSMCPFGVRAVAAIKEVLDNFGDRLTFDLHYIASKRPDGTITALHGPQEVAENTRQLCAKALYPEKSRYLDYLWCRGKDYRSDDWRGCARGGIDPDRIERCAAGRQGRRLLEQDIALTEQLGISASPTWLANNRFKFSAGTPEAIKQQLCQHNGGLPNCDVRLSDTTQKTAGACGK